LIADKDLALEVAEVCKDKKGENIAVMDLSDVSNTLDFFVIVTGSSKSHMRALADGVVEHLKERKIFMRHSEGYGEASWVLLDFGSVIIHIFDKKNRDFYQIERLWGDAKFILYSEDGARA
jgi:ribosome-associated protein